MPELQRVALLGNHLPRHCGIATFTTHLADALAEALPGVDSFVVAMNDAGRRHAYPSRVRFEINEGDLAAYRRAADFLNVNRVDVLSVQHEYGIFGGKAGAHLLTLLRELRMPIVTTLHTILSEPNPSQRAVLEELSRLSERLVVMSASGADLLKRVHGIADDHIDLVPHGIPYVPTGNGSKDRLGVEGKTVILTFGLLSPDKGIKYAIDALPAILAAHPDTVYIVLGATHPHVIQRHGEEYRLFGLFQRTSRPDWPWFEDSVTYCNARLSQALIVSGSRMHRDDMVEAGMRSLAWLVSLQVSTDGHFVAIGSNGFYARGAAPATFDQQPVEACVTTSACLEAYRVSDESRWADQGCHAFNWFLGQNDHHQWLYDPSTGGCRDGLHPDRTNQNQGAEATLSFLMALCELRATDPAVVHATPAFSLQPA